MGSGLARGAAALWFRLKASLEWEIRNEKLEMRNGGAARFVILSGEKRRMLENGLSEIWELISAAEYN